MQLGHTPLHIACLQGHMECVSLLIDNGATIDATDDVSVRVLVKLT
jgi:ankyrin repeat protein